MGEPCITQTEAVPMASQDAAYRLLKEGHHVAVLNFANAFCPGGGVANGWNGQEESLCRDTTLYPALTSVNARPFYDGHHRLASTRASDGLLYTSGVLLRVAFGEALPIDDRMQIDVITAAAPDLRQKWNQGVPLHANGKCMDDAELFGIHVRRAIHILTCAAANGADALVLGAFGCGVFENPPAVVAQAYKTALDAFPKVFRQVLFAVLPYGDNYEVFRSVFGGSDTEEAATA